MKRILSLLVLAFVVVAGTATLTTARADAGVIQAIIAAQMEALRTGDADAACGARDDHARALGESRLPGENGGCITHARVLSKAKRRRTSSTWRTENARIAGGLDSGRVE